MSRRRRAVPVRDTTLTVGAIIGVLCLVALGLCLALGARPMVVTSGSMSPAIPTGSLVLAQTVDAEGVEVGDVVTVTSSEGRRVMHRVIDARPAGDATSLTLQGDANATPDAEPYLVDEVALVRFHVPLVGHPVTWLSTPTGLMLLGVGAAALLYVAFRPNPASRSGRRRRALVRIAVPVAVLAAVGASQPAGAWFDDPATVTSGAVTTYVVPPTTVRCQGLGLLSLRFNWDAVAGATSYTLFYNNGANSLNTTNTTALVGSLINGGSAWVVARRNFGATTWSSVSSNSVGYLVVVVALCD